MALKKCLGCNVMMDASDNKDYCSNCSVEIFHTYSEEKQEELYIKVREYLFNNPRTPKTTVADQMNVSVKIIDKWIKEGKIEEVEGMMTGNLPPKLLVCSSCGTKIKSGILCDHCKKEYDGTKGKDHEVVGFRSSVNAK